MENNYRIEQRAQEHIALYGSVEKAIEHCEKELEEFENAWSKYSSDCLGHGITCNRLLLIRLKKY